MIKWSKEEETSLKNSYSSALSLKEISLNLQRSIRSIKNKSARLGLFRERKVWNKPLNHFHRRNYDKRYYLNNKLKISLNKRGREKQYKKELIALLGGKCQICGYNKCDNAFDFHHIHKDKTQTINRLLKGYSKQKLLKEAKKCILVCANCHREIHSNMGL